MTAFVLTTFLALQGPPAPDPAVVAAGATVGHLADWYAGRVAAPTRPVPPQLVLGAPSRRR